MAEIQQEICPITGDDLFIILDHINAKFEYAIHCHPEYEINVVINTHGTRVIGDSEETFTGLDFVMIGPYIPHVWRSTEEENHVVTIQFSPDLLNYPIMNKRLFLLSSSYWLTPDKDFSSMELMRKGSRMKS